MKRAAEGNLEGAPVLDLERVLRDPERLRDRLVRAILLGRPRLVQGRGRLPKRHATESSHGRR